MKRPIISIIIPIYNTEKYLPKCLDSIITQTYTNWEAILVDDGSTDKSGKICDEYAAKDKRFNVIHQNNGGVSVARQTGLDNAAGDYIIHCDPDDWIEPTMLENMLNCALSHKVDMVICDTIAHMDNSIITSHHNIKNPIKAKKLQDEIINLRIHGALWNKLIRRKCIENITFTPSNISYCEDELFLVRLLNKEISIRYLPKGLYHYVHHKNSLSSPSIRRISSRIVVLEELSKIVSSSNDFFSIKKDILIAAFLSKNFQLLKVTYTEIHKELIYQGISYKVLQPLKSNLSIALRGWPRLAYCLYNINMSIIRIIRKIKNQTS